MNQLLMKGYSYSELSDRQTYLSLTQELAENPEVNEFAFALISNMNMGEWMKKKSCWYWVLCELFSTMRQLGVDFPKFQMRSFSMGLIPISDYWVHLLLTSHVESSYWSIVILLRRNICINNIRIQMPSNETVIDHAFVSQLFQHPTFQQNLQRTLDSLSFSKHSLFIHSYSLVDWLIDYFREGYGYL